MNVYFISGLGADRRAFERLKLPAEYSINYLDWIPPLKKESLNEYAKRLAAAIDTSQPYSIVGLSMGGMIASVMTGFLHPQRTILISSIGCNKELPLWLRLARKTKAYKLVPNFMFHPKALTSAYKLIDLKAGKHKALMLQFILQTNPQFMKWAIGAILNWQDCDRPAKVFQIHGNRDKMLPVRYTRPDVVIPQGSHFMVWTKAGEVSKALESALR